MKNRLTLQEIETFFYDEEIKKLPTVNFCNIANSLNNKNGLLIAKKESFGEFLFKQKVKENWTFNIELELNNGEILLISKAYLNKIDSKIKKYAVGKNLEELFVNYFGEEEFLNLKTKYKE